MYKTMKTHIELGQLIEPTAEQILTLNNHKFRDAIWVQWDKTDHIQEALDVFKKKGWRHSTLIKTEKLCNTTNMIAMLSEYGHVEIKNMHSEYGTKWYVNINHHVEMDKFYFEADELCDAL